MQNVGILADMCSTSPKLTFDHSVVVSTVDTGPSVHPFLFRTYDNPSTQAYNYGAAQDYPIWKVARATSAADLKFEPMVIDGRTYYDGGLGNNNPSPTILDEALTSLGSQISNVINIFVSVGTGVKPRTSEKVKQNLSSIVQRRVGLINAIAKGIDKLKRHGTEVERGHQEMLRFMRSGGQRINENPESYEQYARLNGGDRVGILKLDQWFTTRKVTLGNKTTQEFVDHHMEAYLAQEEVISDLRRCAISLVNHRRARIAGDEDKWRRFAHATLHRCPLVTCPKQFHRSRRMVAQHIQQYHSDWTDRQSLMDNIREYPPRLERGPF